MAGLVGICTLLSELAVAQVWMATSATSFSASPDPRESSCAASVGLAQSEAPGLRGHPYPVRRALAVVADGGGRFAISDGEQLSKIDATTCGMSVGIQACCAEIPWPQVSG